MRVLGNSEFATGMRLAGIKESYVVKTRDQGLEIIKNIPKDEFIIVNISIAKMLPELEEEYKNAVTLPDDPKAFSTTDDLKNIIRSAVGIDLDI